MRRPPAAPLVLVLLALAAGACADRAADEPEPRPSAERTQPAPTGCPAPAAQPLDPATTRRLLDRAAARTTRRGGSFVTELRLRADGLPAARAVLRGRRTSDGSSSGRLQWRGAASLLLPDADLRIARNELSLRPDSPQPAWRPLGSAAGVALDVGRELLMHPFLLDIRTARGTRGAFRAQLVAPTDRLRAYATTERRGPVTELLRQATSLRIEATVHAGRLVADRFALRTRIAGSLPELGPFAGRLVTVTGDTLRPPVTCRASTSAPRPSP